jgi:ferrous iron transport protein A
MATKLSELKQGQRAIIKSFTNNETYLKLMEMGCVPGESILLEQIAPFGDPISVKVSGYLLSLRINEAEHIEVEIIN